MGLMTIIAGTVWVIGALLVPETYAPVLLRKRAQALSERSGKLYKTRVDIEKGDVSPAKALSTALIRPWLLLFMEPIVLILSIYMSIVYGTLYLLFGAFPIVFQIERGWSEGVGGLAFLGVAVGMVAAIAIGPLLNKPYMKVVNANGGFAPPEARLPGCMIGAIAIPIGMFWFAWTSYPSIHYMSPIAAGVPFGFGLTLIFLGIVVYLIDAYTIFAASVLAANTVLRSLFGAAFPLFTRDMYNNLGESSLQGRFLSFTNCYRYAMGILCAGFPRSSHGSCSFRSLQVRCLDSIEMRVRCGSRESHGYTPSQGCADYNARDRSMETLV